MPSCAFSVHLDQLQSSNVRRRPMRSLTARVLALFLFVLPAAAQVSEPSVSDLSKEVQQLVRVSAAKVVLAHVRVIDGTGAAAVEDQNVVLLGGKILNIERGADVAATP